MYTAPVTFPLRGDFYGPTPRPPHPTSAIPGSARKLEVMSQRARDGLSLFHPQDALMPDGSDHEPAPSFSPRPWDREVDLEANRAAYSTALDRSLSLEDTGDESAES